MSDQTGLLREGFRRVWHYQRVLWFIFFINFALSHFGAGAASHKLEGPLDHSLHARRLSEVFDVGAFSEFASNPEVKLFEVMGVSLAFSIVFFVGMLFLSGGILEAYRSGRKLTTREFFEACGTYFWRFVIFFILMAVVLVPLVMVGAPLAGQAGSLIFSPAREKAGFWLAVATTVIVGFALMCIRLWFDMAQVRAVVEEEREILRTVGQAFKITCNNFRTLFWMYFRISVLRWLVFATGIYLWSKMPPARFGTTFLALEFVILFGFGARLWQRACEVIWYQRRFVTQVVAGAPIPPAPEPLLMITPAPIVPPDV